MRLSNLVVPAIVFVAAFGLAVLASRVAVQLVEDSSVVSVRRALDEQSLQWADVDANGLQVFMIGTAPNEAQSFRAWSVAGSVVDAARLINQMDVADRADLAPPRFSLEILRNESGISLIGLIPASTDREAMVEDARSFVAQGQVTDLLEVADYPSPKAWEDVVEFAMETVKALPRSKISAAADRVEVTAMTDTEAEKAEVEKRLLRKVPADVELAMELSAPRPVITPFTLRFAMDDERGARFDACSADTEAARSRIIRAAKKVAPEKPFDCSVGLGVPSTHWAKAAEQTILAVKELGGGVATFTDADISLIALQGTGQGTFDRVVGELEANLPEVFALHAVLPEPEDKSDQGPAEFIAIRSPEGMVQLRGRVNSEITRQTANSFAQSFFGADAVYMSARLDEDLPATWSVRVLAGLEALSLLQNGAVTVSSNAVIVNGNTGHSNATARISALLGEKLGETDKFDIDVTYQEKLDPVASRPTPDQCEESIAALVAKRKINFEPGSANLDTQGRGIMDDIAEILKQCGDIRLEIGGHTDSQGRETMNQQLSQARAQSVLNELRARRVLTSSFSAKGYGETQPIADNKTEAGRDANRRIEFKLIRPKPIKERQTALESLEQSGEEAETGTQSTEGSDEQN